MTKVERRLAGDLLSMASDQFSNHGCNDFDLAQYVPDEIERNVLVKDIYEWNGNEEDLFVYSKEKPDWRIMDWMLMDYLAERLRNIA